MNLESRVERLERQSGMAEVPSWVCSLSDDDRAFYLEMNAREARHPKGFDGLVRTLDKADLIRLIGLLTCEIGDDDMSRLDDATRAEVAEMKRRVGM